MKLLHHMEYFRKEHEALLNLAAKIERLLEAASKDDYAGRLNSLTELRSLAHGIAGIVEHCHSGDRIVESSYYESLSEDERARIDAEHQKLTQVVTNFKEELKFATADRTMAMILPGMELVNQLRSHIFFEQDLLGRTAEPLHIEKKRSGDKNVTKRVGTRKKRPSAKRTTNKEANSVLPYTLERHPEL